MPRTALTTQQDEALSLILSLLARECDAQAVALCDMAGIVLAVEPVHAHRKLDNAAALSAGAFAATRELAAVFGEQEFTSIFYRGKACRILIQALAQDLLIIAVLGAESAEGLVRLYLKKTGRQILRILTEPDPRFSREDFASWFAVEDNTATPATPTPEPDPAQSPTTPQEPAPN